MSSGSCLLLWEGGRGIELDIVQFWSFDSAPYTAVFRDVRTAAESVHYFYYVRLSDRLSASNSAVPTGRIYVKTGGFHENLSRKSKIG